MLSYLPQPLKLSWKEKFFSRQYQSIHNNIISKHVARINKLCKERASLRSVEFVDNSFWDGLKIKSNHSEEVNTLYEHWLKIKPLAHLNTKQLISLLQNEIDPLITAYQNILSEVNVDGLVLLPSFLRLSRDNLLAQINDNLERLTMLKSHLYYGLIARSKVHELLKAPRQVDDVLASLAVEINQLNLLERPLAIPETFGATLNDDRRLTMYDIFRQIKKQAEAQSSNVMHEINFDELVLDEIIEPIPGRSTQVLRPKKEIKRDKQELREFIKEIFQALNLKNFAKQLFSLKKVVRPSLHIPKQVAHYLNVIWKFRYLPLMIISFVGYQYILALISPPVVFLFGINALNFISSTLFYTLGIAPLWVLAWNGANQFINYWKKHELIESLVTLEETQRYISNYLSQTPQDLPHFDIHELLETVNVYQSKVSRASTSVKRFSFLERSFCKEEIFEQVSLIDNRLKRQKKLIQNLVKQLADHISDRIGTEIELLEIDLKKKRLVQAIDHQQIARLKEFVSHYGDKEALKQFEINSNIANRWASKIEKFSFKGKESIFSYPWGNHAIKQDVLKGWNTLLSSFIAEKRKREASLALNDCIMGNKYLTEDQLREKVKVLLKPDEAPNVIAKIQNYLFKTLSQRNPKICTTLSSDHKGQINNWYQNNKAEIDEASKVMAFIMSSLNKPNGKLDSTLDKYSDPQLAKYYELLDGADFYFAIQSKSNETKERVNKVRKFFEDYQGQTSRAFQFIRFIPKDEKINTAVEVAKKRLSWFLNNLDRIDLSHPFNEEDITIFKNLWVENDEFCFNTEVRGSAQFQQRSSQNMITFLRACSRNGLGSAALLMQEYENNVSKTRNEILLQQKQFIKKDKPKVNIPSNKYSSPSVRINANA